MEVVSWRSLSACCPDELSLIIRDWYYQGLASAMALTFLFTAFSIYYVRTRRIAPVILAHLCLDLFSLIRGAF